MMIYGHPIFKGILGIIALLTVLPALMVEGQSEQGYFGTFFGKPAANPAKQLAKVQSEYEKVESSIAQHMQAPVAVF